MCGIFFALYNETQRDFNTNRIDFELLKKRGPNSFKTLELELENNLRLDFAASVLGLRGSDYLTEQPLTDPHSGNVLLWNGELFHSDRIRVKPDENDSLCVFNELCKNSGQKSEKEIFEAFEAIKGPYAFIFYWKKTNSLYFGRDRLGRRSLLINVTKNHSIFVSSVQVKSKNNAFESHFEELKANKIYKLDLNTEPKFIEVFDWKKSLEKLTQEIDIDSLSNIECRSSNLHLTDSIASFNDTTDDYLNVDQKEFEQIGIQFYDILKQAVKRRVENLPKLCKACSMTNLNTKLNNSACEHAKVAVMFSGGVDSTVLAALADLCIPADEPIDLLNIAFEKQKKSDNSISDDFMVPDRVSGLKSLTELNPKRKWNFVEINVSLEELRQERDGVIRNLLFPHQTVLDDSIGCALWFASRGRGYINCSGSLRTEYTSNAEILILGMGADEQLAGYARHRTRYENYGIESLVAEVKMEMKRISERNLGRDDRILSDHGKESRLPFLDEDVVSFLNELHIKYKCDMKQPRGYGEKILLRKLAEQRLNLKFAASLQKRAIQFGSRVAKIENCKEKASDVCNRLTKNLKIED